jgi:hypothetical protein
MTKKNLYLLDQYNDENEVVEWLNNNSDCCLECLCDDNTKCSNCSSSDDNNNNNNNGFINNNNNNNNNNGFINLVNYDINIIKNKKDKQVRITLQLKIILDNKKTKVITINLDINSNTYLKFAEKLSN